MAEQRASATVEIFAEDFASDSVESFRRRHLDRRGATRLLLAASFRAAVKRLKTEHLTPLAL